MNDERTRLLEIPTGRSPWRRWGPYLSERGWGTVREDHSATGVAWELFPHDHARSRAYRWNEDGLAGICDDRQTLCFALAVWNSGDPILKERIFGLTGNEGNHGEDAKEYWSHLDCTPTHSWMRWSYMYPRAEYPYARIVAENQARGTNDPEFELVDTGISEDALQVQCPTGTGQMMALDGVADDLAGRLIGIFLAREDGSRPIADLIIRRGRAGSEPDDQSLSETSGQRDQSMTTEEPPR